MKLYATTTTERASKGQGGNEYMGIDVGIGSKDFPMPVLWVFIKRVGEEYLLTVTAGNRQVVYKDTLTFRERIKGNKQKDECQHNYCDDNAICINCGEHQ